jgi:hypothetical protein
MQASLKHSGYVVATLIMLSACANDNITSPRFEQHPSTPVTPVIQTMPAADSVMIAEFHIDANPDYQSMSYFGKNTPDFSVGTLGESASYDGLEYSLFNMSSNPRVLLSGSDWITIEVRPYITYGLNSDSVRSTYSILSDVQPLNSASHPGIYIDSMSDLYIRTRAFSWDNTGVHLTSVSTRHLRARIGSTSATDTLPITLDGQTVESWQTFRMRCIHGGDSITIGGNFLLKVDDEYMHAFDKFQATNLTVTCTAYGAASVSQSMVPDVSRSSAMRITPRTQTIRWLK